jgi:hypothetical protein
MKLSKDLKSRIIISLTDVKAGKELIAALEKGDVLSGKGVPSNSLGTNGDLYVNLNNANLYSKANNAWTLVAGEGGGAATWGTITGTLSDQTDLQNSLDDKVDVAGDTMTGPLNVESGTDTVTLSSNGLSSDANLNLTTDSSVTDPTKDIFIKTGDAAGSNYAGSVYINGGENVDGNPANVQIVAGRSIGTGPNGSVILDAKNVVYLNQNPTGGITASDHRIENVADPIGEQDAATRKWVDEMSAIDNIIFVSPNANLFIADGSLNRPYATIAAALAVAVDNDLVALLPGTYNEPTVIVPSSLSYLTIQGVASSSVVVNNGISYTPGASSIDLSIEKVNIGTFTLDASAALNGKINLKQVVTGYNRQDNNPNVLMVTTESVCFTGVIAGGANNFSECLMVVSMDVTSGALVIFENTKFVGYIELYGSAIARLLDCELFGAPFFINGSIDFGNTPTIEIDTSSDALGALSGDYNKVLLANIPLANLTQSGANTGEVATWDGSNWVPTDVVGTTLESTGTIVGIQDPSQVVLTIDDSLRKLSVSPVSGSFTCFAKGKKIVVSSTLEANWPDSHGLHFFYIDQTGSLITTDTFVPEIITEHAFFSVIYWDEVENKHIYFANEKHGINMGTSTHLYLHTTRGAQFDNGLRLTMPSVDGTGNLPADAQFSSTSGAIWDEDIKLTISSQSEFPVMYRSGTVWKRKEADSFPLIYNGTVGYTGTRPAYNSFDGTNWALTEVTNNKWFLVHVFATNDIEYPVMAILGQQEYNSKANARAGAKSELQQLSGMPFAEFHPLGSVIYEVNNTYGNTPKAKIVSTDLGDDYQDHRGDVFRPGTL